MKIILEGKEADAYILSRQIAEVESLVDEIKSMHDGLLRCNRFELTDVCNRLNNILESIATNEALIKLAQLSTTIR